MPALIQTGRNARQVIGTDCPCQFSLHFNIICKKNHPLTFTNVHENILSSPTRDCLGGWETQIAEPSWYSGFLVVSLKFLHFVFMLDWVVSKTHGHFFLSSTSQHRCVPSRTCKDRLATIYLSLLFPVFLASLSDCSTRVSSRNFKDKYINQNFGALQRSVLHLHFQG